MQSCYSIHSFACSRIILGHWDDTISRAGRKATFHSFDSDSELRWRVKYCLVRQRQVLPRAAKHDEHVKMPLSTSVHCGQRKARGTSGHLWPMICVDASRHHPDNYITNPDILKHLERFWTPWHEVAENEHLEAPQTEDAGLKHLLEERDSFADFCGWWLRIIYVRCCHGPTQGVK